KTFTMSHVVANVNKPTLVIAPNKTLAAQLYNEFRTFFPENAVRYFVSYYDYYQPEAYVPSTDTYIEKDASINDEIDKMRHAATKVLLERNDVVVVASVSCIYGLGSPASYFDMLVFLDREPLRGGRGGHEARGRDDPGRAGRAARGAQARAQAARGAALGAAHALRPRAPRRDGLLPRHRELLAPPRRPRPGAAALHAPRLLPRGLPARHRREPRHRATDRRHVPRRPLPKRDAGRVRLPPPVRARQPPAQLRGVHAPRTPDALRLGHPRGVGDPPGPRPRRRAA